MTVLDTNVVAVVLPTIARDLGASFAEVQWVVSTYVLCFAALLLPAVQSPIVSAGGRCFSAGSACLPSLHCCAGPRRARRRFIWLAVPKE